MNLISLNVEGARHWQTVTSFLRREHAHVIALQEAHPDYVHFLETLGYQTYFSPSSLMEQNGIEFAQGLLLASLYDFEPRTLYYHKPTDTLQPEVVDPKTGRSSIWRQLLVAQFTTNGGIFVIATTHFTWSPDGHPNDIQRTDLGQMLQTTKTLPPHLLCGDFNIPRLHNELYLQLANVYTDNIPPQYRSSLDRTLHRAGNDPERAIVFDEYMVDYLFSQPAYNVTDVRLEFGVSDHAAVIGEVAQAL